MSDVKSDMDMEIKPYGDGEGKRAQVERMFDGIARSYDLLNHVLSFGVDKGWRRRAIGLLGDLRQDKEKIDLGKGQNKQGEIDLEKGQGEGEKIAGENGGVKDVEGENGGEELGEKMEGEVLDVATGTGDMAIALHRRLGVRVVGCDISPKMVEVGREKVERLGLGEWIRLEVGDSESLPFGSGSFGAVTVAFGVRNFADLDKGLREMGRVLRSGGRLVVLEFSTPRNAVFRGLYNFYFRNILPLIGGAVSHDREAYRYLCRSAMAFPSGEEFEKHLRAAGLRPVSSTLLTCGIATAYLAEKD